MAACPGKLEMDFSEASVGATFAAAAGLPALADFVGEASGLPGLGLVSATLVAAFGSPELGLVVATCLACNLAFSSTILCSAEGAMEVDRERVGNQRATLASSAACSLSFSVERKAFRFLVAAYLQAVTVGSMEARWGPATMPVAREL